ncbi:MAG: DEAD/DEAH box helicase family protein [Deltaproteobacteria bacterium]|nr:DEAD/DEAH box helicase family protein [Deltaproteobacteria bacterium]
MKLSDSERLRTAMDGWATSAGYTNAAAVPMSRARELIDSVAQQTKTDAAVVRDALLGTSNDASEKAGKSAASLGTQASYQGAKAHKPISDTSALATLMSAKKKPAAEAKPKSAVDALASKDKTFSQLVADFEATRFAITDRARPKALEELNEACTKLAARFQEVKKSPDNHQVQAEVTRLFKDLLSNVAKKRGIFLTKADPAGAPIVKLDEPGAKPASTSGPVRAARYEKLEKAATADGTPELDAAAPHVLSKDLPSLAVDGQTGESFLVEFHGRVKAVYSVEGYMQAFREVTADEDKRVKLAATPEAVELLRSVSDKALAKLTGEPDYVSLLENAETQIARVYPTKWLKAQGSILSRQVISDGPFKGIFLDDLVNSIAPTGKGYAFDPKLGPSTPITPRAGEPWITTATVMERGKKVDKLYVRIPFEKQYTQIRQALRRLSQLDPSIRYDEGTKNTSFYFPNERYKVVRDVLKGTVLSPAASAKLEAYFADLTKIELAASNKALASHTTEAIGGFKTNVVGGDGRARKLEMTYWQKKSIAMLEALGYRGVLGLGTGMGKTLAAIGVMQELKTRHGEERPFLIVCPKALRGNFAKEIHKFLEPQAAKALIDKLVVLDYQQFGRAATTGELGGKPFNAEKFGAVIFDESQWIRKRQWKASKAALAFDHPRKICMSASVMKDSFDDVMTQVSIAANVNLQDRKEGKELRAQARKFKLQSCTEIGGRTLGVKQEVELLPGVTVDPKHDLYTWVKKHVIYADKRMDDTKLPKFKLSAETLTMPKEMELEYRKTTKRIDKLLRGMVSLYRDKGVAREYVDDKGRKRTEIEKLARNRNIGRVFGPKMKKLIDQVNALGNTPEKTRRAGDLIFKHLDNDPRSRAILFSDSAEYVAANAKQLSNQIPGKLHAACLGNEIRIFQNGEELKSIAGHTLPLKPGEYKKDPNAPANADTNRAYAANEWQNFALNEIIGPNGEIATTTMFGPVYQEGQNLQWANVGIHLDRDSWSRQNTLQREGRLWRKDQKREVSFYNLDWVLRAPTDRLDRSLDEIRSFHEQIGGKLFDDLIVTPQKTVKLGEEWSDVREKDALRIDFSLLHYGIAPSSEKAGGLEEVQ